MVEEPKPRENAVSAPEATPPQASASLEGVKPSLAGDTERVAALDAAFDYRGDVTLDTTDGQRIVGYVFDRRRPGDRGTTEPCVRVIPADGSPRVTVPYARIAGLWFSGRDTAAGKSFETWLKKWKEKKLKGETAELTPEEL
jgi:hypothetical protein